MNFNNENKLISCCELLTLFERYFRKQFGVDGMILFDDEVDPTFAGSYSLTQSLFTYLEKNKQLCPVCSSG